MQVTILFIMYFNTRFIIKYRYIYYVYYKNHDSYVVMSTGLMLFKYNVVKLDAQVLMI